MANSIQVEALAQLLIEAEVITQEQFFRKLKRVQTQYQKNEPIS
jgi:hypothetical protein